MSGAVVCVQEVPPFVVTKTPRFVLDPLEESEIEAYTVLSVANCGEIPRSMRPTFDVGSPPDSRENVRSEEHTSELQSRLHLVCRLLLEKKKKITANV